MEAVTAALCAAAFGAVASLRAKTSTYVLFGAADACVWVLASVLSGAFAAACPPTPPAAAIVIACAIVCAVTDVRTGLIFDAVLVAAGLALLVSVTVRTTLVAHALFGALVCGGIMAGLHVVTRGKGLGFGDVKLATVIGAGLGVTHGLIALGSAFIFGASVACASLAFGWRRLGDTVRFGPYVAAGAMVATAFDRLFA